MYKWILPLRYLIRKPISYVALISIAACVFIVLIVMTILNGLVVNFAEKNHNFYSDCIISSDSLVGFGSYEEFIDILHQSDFVEAAAPVIKTFALLTTQAVPKGIAVDLMGIDIDRHIRTTGFADTLYYRKNTPLLAFSPVYEPHRAGCVIGIDMILRRSETGRYIHNNSPRTLPITITCFGLTEKGALRNSVLGSAAASKTFYLSDDSHSKIAKLDSSTVYVSFADAQMLCRMNQPTPRTSAIFIKFKNGVDLDIGTHKVALLWKEFVKSKTGSAGANLLDLASVQSWKGYRREIIAPMEKEQTMMIMLFVMVGIITVFIIFVIFYMIISHKSKDIGILKSIGASQADLVVLFLNFAFIIAVIGSALGVAGGWAFLTKVNDFEAFLFEKYNWQLWDRTIYAIDDIPNQIQPKVVIWIIASAVAASLIGAAVPTTQAAKQKCANILQVSGI